MCIGNVNVFSISKKFLLACQSSVPLKIIFGDYREIRDWYFGLTVGIAGKYLRSLTIGFLLACKGITGIPTPWILIVK